MNAAVLHARDSRRRERLGWSGCAFIAPKLPRPSSASEIAARRLFAEYEKRILPGHPVTVHVYEVVEMLEEAHRRGREFERQFRKAVRFLGRRAKGRT